MISHTAVYWPYIFIHIYIYITKDYYSQNCNIFNVTFWIYLNQLFAITTLIPRVAKVDIKSSKLCKLLLMSLF